MDIDVSSSETISAADLRVGKRQTFDYLLNVLSKNVICYDDIRPGLMMSMDHLLNWKEKRWSARQMNWKSKWSVSEEFPTDQIQNLWELQTEWRQAWNLSKQYHNNEKWRVSDAKLLMIDTQYTLCSWKAGYCQHNHIMVEMVATKSTLTLHSYPTHWDCCFFSFQLFLLDWGDKNDNRGKKSSVNEVVWFTKMCRQLLLELAKLLFCRHLWKNRARGLHFNSFWKVFL